MLNVSTRAIVSPSTGATISGLVIQGSVAKRVLVRAAGPSLASFGVNNALANPRLEMRDASGTIVATNDDWESGNDRAAVVAASAAAGAFPFAAGSQDAALLTTLLPGNYTVIIEGVGGSSGVTLAEIYEVP